MIQHAGVAVDPATTGSLKQASLLGRWLLAFLLGGSYMGAQLAITLPILMVLLASGHIRARQDALNSEPMLWGALVAVGIAAVVTIALAWAWPIGWKALFTKDVLSAADWLAWRAPRVIPLWIIPFITIPVLVALAGAIYLTVGSSEVDLQLKLFSSPGLRILASVIVISVVPLAEELIFRGALYNALLRPRQEGVQDWKRNLLPVLVTGIAFAAVHLLAGVNTLAGMIQITILSFYLCALRAVTGSVKASFVAHATWNVIGAIALSAANVIK